MYTNLILAPLLLVWSVSLASACCTKKCINQVPDASSNHVAFQLKSHWLEVKVGSTWVETLATGTHVMKLCLNQTGPTKDSFIITNMTVTAMTGSPTISKYGRHLEGAITSSIEKEHLSPHSTSHENSKLEYQLQYKGCNDSMIIGTDTFADSQKEVTSLCVQVTRKEATKSFVKLVKTHRCDSKYVAQCGEKLDNKMEVVAASNQTTADLITQWDTWYCWKPDTCAADFIPFWFLVDYTKYQVDAINGISFGKTGQAGDEKIWSEKNMKAPDNQYWMHMDRSGGPRLTEVYLVLVHVSAKDENQIKVHWLFQRNRRQYHKGFWQPVHLEKVVMLAFRITCVIPVFGFLVVRNK